MAILKGKPLKIMVKKVMEVTGKKKTAGFPAVLKC